MFYSKIGIIDMSKKVIMNIEIIKEIKAEIKRLKE